MNCETLNTLKFLWVNRKKPKLLKILWWKTWGKRVFRLNFLISLLIRASWLRIKGSVIDDLTIINMCTIKGNHKNLRISQGTFIGKNSQMFLHNTIDIQENVVINDGVIILTGSHDIKDPNWPLITKQVLIKRYAWIATNATILPGVIIGEGAVVGAGSVVSKNVPDFTVVAGNPAKVVSKRVKEVNYTPVRFCSAFEAWVGKS